MSAKLTLVREIASNNSISSLQLMLSTLFGGMMPEIYNPDKIYSTGDLIVDTQNGYVIYAALEDNVTGSFDASKWTKVSFSDLFKEGSPLKVDFTKVAQIKENQPMDEENIIWYKSINTYTIDKINI